MSHVQTAGGRRLHRAAVARRALDKAADAAAALDWAMLDAAPAWLGLPEPALSLFARRVGARLYARDMRLWIDGARITAARKALGDAYLQALLAEPDAPAFEGPGRPRLDSADRVATLLQAAGSGVLLASMTPSALRRVASDVLGPAIDLPMTPAEAQALIERALAVEAAA